MKSNYLCFPLVSPVVVVGLAPCHTMLFFTLLLYTILLQQHNTLVQHREYYATNINKIEKEQQIKGGKQ